MEQRRGGGELEDYMRAESLRRRIDPIQRRPEHLVVDHRCFLPLVGRVPVRHPARTVRLMHADRADVVCKRRHRPTPRVASEHGVLIVAEKRSRGGKEVVLDDQHTALKQRIDGLTNGREGLLTSSQSVECDHHVPGMNQRQDGITAIFAKNADEPTMASEILSGVDVASETVDVATAEDQRLVSPTVPPQPIEELDGFSEVAEVDLQKVERDILRDNDAGATRWQHYESMI